MGGVPSRAIARGVRAATATVAVRMLPRQRCGLSSWLAGAAPASAGALPPHAWLAEPEPPEAAMPGCAGGKQDSIGSLTNARTGRNGVDRSGGPATGQASPGVNGPTAARRPILWAKHRIGRLLKIRSTRGFDDRSECRMCGAADPIARSRCKLPLPPDLLPFSSRKNLLFLKKKKQKDFYHWRPGNGPRRNERKRMKVFWFFFSKKNYSSLMSSFL